jgi:hypothetical protein
MQRSTPSQTPGGLASLLAVNTINVVLQRRGRVLAVLLLLTGLVTLALFVSQLGRTPVLITLAQFSIALAILVALYFVNRSGRVSVAGILFSLFLLAANFLLFDLRGDQLPGPAILIVPVLLAGLLAPPAWAFGVALLAIGGHLRLLLLDGDPVSALEPAPLLGVYGTLLVTAFAAWMFARITSAAMEEGARTSASLAYQQQMLEERAATQSRYLQATISIARTIVARAGHRPAAGGSG